VFVGSPFVARQHPHELELVPVRVGAIDALGRAVVGLAGMRAGVDQRTGKVELLDRI
jgi:hypothetical protein